MVAVAQVAGLGLVAAGVFLLSVPAGLIVSGLAVLLFSVAWERSR